MEDELRTWRLKDGQQDRNRRSTSVAASEESGGRLLTLTVMHHVLIHSPSVLSLPQRRSQAATRASEHTAKSPLSEAAPHLLFVRFRGGR